MVSQLTNLSWEPLETLRILRQTRSATMKMVALKMVPQGRVVFGLLVSSRTPDGGDLTGGRDRTIRTHCVVEPEYHLDASSRERPGFSCIPGD